MGVGQAVGDPRSFDTKFFAAAPVRTPLQLSIDKLELNGQIAMLLKQLLALHVGSSNRCQFRINHQTPSRGRRRR